MRAATQQDVSFVADQREDTPRQLVSLTSRFLAYAGHGPPAEVAASSIRPEKPFRSSRKVSRKRLCGQEEIPNGEQAVGDDYSAHDRLGREERAAHSLFR